VPYKIEPEHTRDWLTHAFKPSADGHSRDEINPRDGRSLAGLRKNGLETVQTPA
jgi:hypothetical protein